MSPVSQRAGVSLGLLVLAFCRGCCADVETVKLDVHDGSYTSADDTVETDLRVELNEDVVTIHYQSTAGVVELSYVVTNREYVDNVGDSE
jgi:hypothetical protein